MSDEIQLISDGDGLAVIGDPALVDNFLLSEGLSGKELNVTRLSSTFSSASTIAQTASDLSANSGRWMKLTKESSEAMKKFDLVKNKDTGFSHAILRGENGKFAKNLQFENGMGALATNPALLANAGALMSQMAMQQTVKEITDYLSSIDDKVNDLLRAQKDAVLADMIGVGLGIEEAMSIKEEGGRVSDVTWSKIESSSSTLARTQAYSLRQLDALAKKLEAKSRVSDLDETIAEIEPKVVEWLAVLARTFQLQEAVGILELDRVLDSSPQDLDSHRVGLNAARSNRRRAISQTTDQLVARMDSAGDKANRKVLVHPRVSPATVQSSNRVSEGVVEFQERLGIESARQDLQVRQWAEAVGDVRDKAVDVANEGISTVTDFGRETADKARDTRDKFQRGARAFINAYREADRRDREDAEESAKTDPLREGTSGDAGE